MNLLGILLLASCGSESVPETEEVVEEKEDIISYDRLCLDDSGCVAAERMAALLDYTGAVYGFSDKFNFDGQLSEGEKKFSIDTFVPQEVSDPFTSSYFSETELTHFFDQARMHFLKSLGSQILPEREDCQSIERLSLNQTGQQGLLLSGAHRCFYEFGEAYQSSGDELKVAADPSSWVFVLEGEQSFPEIQLFQKISQILDIPKVQPGAKITDRDVIKATAERYKPNDRDYLVALAYALFVESMVMYDQRQGYDGLNSSEMDRAFSLAMKKLEETVSMDNKEKSEVEMDLLRLCGATLEMQSTEEIWAAYGKQAAGLNGISQKRIAELTVLANEIGGPRLKTGIEGYAQAGRNQSLFVMDERFRPSVDLVYTLPSP